MTLKNRKRVTTSIDKKLVEKLEKLTDETRIAKSKLFDEALELLFKKHKV